MYTFTIVAEVKRTTREMATDVYSSIFRLALGPSFFVRCYPMRAPHMTHDNLMVGSHVDTSDLRFSLFNSI